MAKGIWVYIEHNNGQIKKVSLEILTAGRKLADQLGEELCAVMVGKDVKNLASSLGNYGAEKVYVAEDEKLENYTTDGYANVVAGLIKENEPFAFLLGYTITGRDLGAQVAQKAETGLMSDCVDIVIEDGQLVFKRPIYAGKAFVQVTCPEARPIMASIRPNSFIAAENKKDIQVVDASPQTGDIRQQIKDIVRQVLERPELTEADIIVSGGRGMKGPENFNVIEGLADVLGAAVGASRAAVDAGWVPHSMQVGQTGKTVSPVLYIACGISGAIQHLAGMGSSKCIVAINKDPEANIFKVADYGIVGDLFEVIPVLKEELEKIVSA